MRECMRRARSGKRAGFLEGLCLRCGCDVQRYGTYRGRYIPLFARRFGVALLNRLRTSGSDFDLYDRFTQVLRNYWNHALAFGLWTHFLRLRDALVLSMLSCIHCERASVYRAMVTAKSLDLNSLPLRPQ